MTPDYHHNDELLFRVLLDANPRMPRREMVERLRELARSGSAAIDLWIGVLDLVYEHEALVPPGPLFVEPSEPRARHFYSDSRHGNPAEDTTPAMPAESVGAL
jgi:hypothetical protein